MKLHMGNKINDKNVFSLNLKLAEAIFQRYQKWDFILHKTWKSILTIFIDLVLCFGFF